MVLIALPPSLCSSTLFNLSFSFFHFLYSSFHSHSLYPSVRSSHILSFRPSMIYVGLGCVEPLLVTIIFVDMLVLMTVLVLVLAVMITIRISVTVQVTKNNVRAIGQQNQFRTGLNVANVLSGRMGSSAPRMAGLTRDSLRWLCGNSFASMLAAASATFFLMEIRVKQRGPRPVSTPKFGPAWFLPCWQNHCCFHPM